MAKSKKTQWAKKTGYYKTKGYKEARKLGGSARGQYRAQAMIAKVGLAGPGGKRAQQKARGIASSKAGRKAQKK